MRRIILLLLAAVCLSGQTISQMLIPDKMIIGATLNGPSNVAINNTMQEPKEKKSVLLAVVSSLIIPGLGELYAGSFETGKYNTIAEGGIWLTYAGFRLHGNWLRQDAHLLAEEHAGADFNGKDDQFDVNIGNFLTTDAYNLTKLRNREYALVYTDSRYSWQWDSDLNRARFKDLRIGSDKAYNDAKFVIAAAVINRLISAFSAGRAAAAYNRSIAEDSRIQIRSFMMSDGARVSGIGLVLLAEL
jgi:TM2 domain-containing membrane protein YozV